MSSCEVTGHRTMPLEAPPYTLWHLLTPVWIPVLVLDLSVRHIQTVWRQFLIFGGISSDIQPHHMLIPRKIWHSCRLFFERFFAFFATFWNPKPLKILFKITLPCFQHKTEHCFSDWLNLEQWYWGWYCTWWAVNVRVKTDVVPNVLKTSQLGTGTS